MQVEDSIEISKEKCIKIFSLYSGNLPEQLKVRSTFKVKSLARPKLDLPKKKIICEIFYKALILREWKKGKANGKEIKKYIEIY